MQSLQRGSSPNGCCRNGLFLHRVEGSTRAKRRMLEKFHRSDPVLAGRKVCVDDDVRNILR